MCLRSALPGGGADHHLLLPLLLLPAPRQGSAWQVQLRPGRSPTHSSSSSSALEAAGGDCGGNGGDACLQAMARPLDKMDQIGQPAFASEFNRRRIRSVEVRESSVPGAGLGLFARENIKGGTIVAFYPAHALGMTMTDAQGYGTVRRVGRDASGTVTSDVDSDGDEEGNHRDRDEAYLHHLLGKRPLMGADVAGDLGGGTLFVDVDLGREGSPGFDGHRVNDGATVGANSEEGALEYYRASRKAKNCVHVPFGPAPLLATVATRKIKKGSELFTTYGCSYWLDVLMKQTGEAEETDMTDPIVAEAREVAMDVLQGMRGVAVTHASEAEELQTIFDSA